LEERERETGRRSEKQQKREREGFFSKIKKGEKRKERKKELNDPRRKRRKERKIDCLLDYLIISEKQKEIEKERFFST